MPSVNQQVIAALVVRAMGGVGGGAASSPGMRLMIVAAWPSRWYSND